MDSYVVLCDWLVSLSMFTRFIYVVACISTSFLFLNYLFIYLAMPGLSCSMRDLRCHMWDLCCGMWDPLAAACGIFSCSMWTLSCGMWDLVSWPGIKPGSPALGVQSLSCWTTSEVSVLHFLLLLNNILLHGYTTFYLFIYQLMNIWIVSTFWLLLIYCYEHSGTSFCVDICFYFS